MDAAEPPRRIFLGRGMIEVVEAEFEQRMVGWEKWRKVSEAARGK
ncbi:hypothetical protein [Pseudonocardia spinosispora]|nr:hypothetical protein [Pseudonocardia spinosispora]